MASSTTRGGCWPTCALWSPRKNGAGESWRFRSPERELKLPEAWRLLAVPAVAAAHHREPPRFARLETGVSGLDAVLGGGLIAKGLYLIEGHAGAGKTILATQIAFSRSKQGKSALYVSLLAESHAKLLNHLRDLSFFDETAVTRTLTFLSGYGKLAEEGFAGFLEFLAAALHQRRPDLLVLDGVRTLHDLDVTQGSFAKFIHELGALGALSGCTTLLLAPNAETSDRPERTLVDGIVTLNWHSSGMRRSRELEVQKLRGAAHLSGRHAFRISNDGVTVFPRLEALLTERGVKPPGESLERLRFGIDGLDRMVSGGLVAGSTTAVLGAPGIGKTLFGLHYLAAGVAQGEPGIYFGFFESPPRLIAKALGVGLDLRAGVENGQLQIIWQPPLELLLDDLGQRLITAARERGARRLVLDGIEGFRESAERPERFVRFASALMTELRTLGVTTVFTEEMPLFNEKSRPTALGVSALVENILVLRYAERGGSGSRLLTVTKLRESAHDRAIREFTISDGGITLGAVFDPGRLRTWP